MKLVCIGSGNVATHLSLAFKAMGADILQVWSRDVKRAGILAALTGSRATSNWSEIDRNADCYLIAVKDDAIASVAAELKEVRGIVIHTSGTTPLSILQGSGSGCGVLYPLQTFSASKAVEITKVPFCVEANSPHNLELVTALASLISPNVYPVDSAQRKILHLSAVFACNFTNHLYAIGQQLLEANGLNFDMLRPLIQETALKVQSSKPSEVQTGPAVRHDEQTLKAHKQLLEGSAEWSQIYEILSNSIKKAHP
ncbi:oxidoreductase [Pedobacter antarcticus 4BY]|uniref:Oxidoreductase n=2 Tax=Pedobacter antarcticus TaxID=34086 RepID=A0A081PFE3_9SPHI|nr:DUF2520 domain-containing protein [Pedobacter antarcticus]KEQ29416.1 oxidoreductase [Pedobacter antarcticus 4BY]SFF39967.1 Predicted oxidoreductase, contains short-chain dehydrogenase (SDR) and DUF2520 domains [Pedobacter antarcticus]